MEAQDTATVPVTGSDESVPSQITGLSKTKQKRLDERSTKRGKRAKSRRNKTSVAKGPELLSTSTSVETSSDLSEHSRARTAFIGRTEASAPAQNVPTHTPDLPFDVSTIQENIRAGWTEHILGLLGSGFHYFVNEEYSFIRLCIGHDY